MKPIVIRFPPAAKLGEPQEAEVLLFPRMRERLAEIVKHWNERGYAVSNNLRGRLVLKKDKKASRAAVFFNRIRRQK